jgi:hypothetical protein
VEAESWKNSYPFREESPSDLPVSRGTPAAAATNAVKPLPARQAFAAAKTDSYLYKEKDLEKT